MGIEYFCHSFRSRGDILVIDSIWFYPIMFFCWNRPYYIGLVKLPSLSPDPCADPVKILHALCRDLGSSGSIISKYLGRLAKLEPGSSSQRLRGISAGSGVKLMRLTLPIIDWAMVSQNLARKKIKKMSKASSSQAASGWAPPIKVQEKNLLVDRLPELWDIVGS